MKKLFWFMFGAIAGPVAVVGIVFLIAERSTRPPTAPEGDAVSTPWGAIGVETHAVLPVEMQRDIARAIVKGGHDVKGKGVPTYSVLTLSGGGSNGAYGAGLLCGWTASGTRPDFKVVTGVSTGSLQATFAFLGPEYDAPLKEVFTLFDTERIWTKRSPLAAAFEDGLYDSSPLKEIIDRYVTQEVLAAVAAKHLRGYRLYVGTTNLDTARFVIWDLGEIASSGRPDALEHYRSILLASSSIPVLFPPVYFPVEEDGEIHYEMHADGGTYANVFFRAFLLAYPQVFREAKAVGEIKVRAYIIRNGKLLDIPFRRNVKPRTTAIASTTITTLFEITMHDQLHRIYMNGKRHGVDFNLAAIPATTPDLDPMLFDLARMGELFNLGYSQADQGYEWRKEPPGLDPMESAMEAIPKNE